MTHAERSKAIEEKMKRLVVAVEKERPGKRAEVAEVFRGKTYVLFIYDYIKDVRLVYAPPRAIGEFGGEADNWMWPRHTGDFTIFRIYGDSLGTPAPYSENNIPIKVTEVAPGLYFQYHHQESNNAWLVTDEGVLVIHAAAPAARRGSARRHPQDHRQADPVGGEHPCARRSLLRQPGVQACGRDHRFKAAAEQAERLRKYVQSLVILSGENEITITLSMGLAQYKVHHEDWQGFLSRADAALYQAKTNGRNRWVVAGE